MKAKLISSILITVLGFFSVSASAAQLVATPTHISAGYAWITPLIYDVITLRGLVDKSNNNEVAMKVYAGSVCFFYLLDTVNYTVNEGADCTNFTIHRIR